MAKVGNLERMQEEEEEEEQEEDLPFQMDAEVGGGSDGGTRRRNSAVRHFTAGASDLRRPDSAQRIEGGGGVGCDSLSRSNGGYSDDGGERFFRGRSLTADSATVSGGAAPLGISRSRRYRGSTVCAHPFKDLRIYPFWHR
jgi:hypothetical protein